MTTETARTSVSRARTSELTAAQNAAVDGYLEENLRTYSWLVDQALRHFLAAQSPPVRFPEKYGVRRAA